MLVMKGAGTMLIKEVAVKLGINEALFLQQLHYFLQQRGVEKEGRIWFFHTYNNWLQHFPYISKSSLRRAVRSLEKRGVIHRRPDFNTRKSDHTMWYTIDYDCLHRLFEEADVTLAIGGAQHDQPACSKWTQPSVQNDPNDALKLDTSILKELDKRKIEDVVIYLNTCTGNYFSVMDENVTNPILTKLRQGYSIEWLKEMIMRKNGTCNMHPQHLFAVEG
ncbi:hypothetical protein [Lysinibacillus sp. LZ02]|uniref:hypothetical protein n=1 Tax=Lysinibacillus sp. LZ02 TaxID=3420668 RepID=UPI003D36E935